MLRVALTHYAPVPDTLAGEPPEIYRYLGSDLLGQAIDAAGADLAIHGHAHLGTECGSTPAGVPVRNVAQPVLNRPYAIYPLSPPSVRRGPSQGQASDFAEDLGLTVDDRLMLCSTAVKHALGGWLHATVDLPKDSQRLTDWSKAGLRRISVSRAGTHHTS